MIAQWDYEVVWDGAHKGTGADLLITPASQRPEKPVDLTRVFPKGERVSRPPIEKYCLECGQQFFLRWASEGPKAHRPKGRRFCSIKCASMFVGRGRILPGHMLKVSSAYCRTRRWFKLQPCEVCGTTINVHRHHRDGNPYNNDARNIGFLCRFHHALEHKDNRAGLRARFLL